MKKTTTISENELAKRQVEIQVALDQQEKSLLNIKDLKKEEEAIEKRIKEKQGEETELAETIKIQKDGLDELDKKIVYANEQVTKGNAFLVDFQKQLLDIKKKAEEKHNAEVAIIEADAILKRKELEDIKKEAADAKKTAEDEIKALKLIEEAQQKSVSEIGQSIRNLKEREAELKTSIENNIETKNQLTDEIERRKEIKKENEEMIETQIELDAQIKKTRESLDVWATRLTEIENREGDLSIRETAFNKRRVDFIDVVNQLMDTFDKPEAQRHLSKFL